MYRLPPPNWNIPPSHLNGDFSMQNLHHAPRGPYPSFMPGLNTYYQPRNQVFVPRAPFNGGPTFDNSYELYKKQQHKIESNNKDQGGSTQKTTQEFYCDACERFFNTKLILDTHLATHEECDQEGCSFQASRKILKLHHIQKHAEGRMRIVLETPEQIEKWREERRKKYPTAANIEKKLAEEKEKIEKGQVAQNRTYRYRGKNQRGHNQQNRDPNHQRDQRRFPNQNKNQYHKSHEQNGQDSFHLEKEIDTPEKKQQSQEGDPLSLVLLSGDDRNSDSEVGTSKQTSVVLTPESNTPDNTSALMSLCASYGDMSSDEDDKPDEINNNVKEDKPTIDTTEHGSTVKGNMKTNPSNSNSRRRKRTREQGPQRGMIKQAKRKPTLLEKLLAPEIRHENNIILQCIRYIVKKNFFDVVPQENSTALPSP